MQDQGKRLLIAVSLALGVMLVWQLVFPSKPDKKPDVVATGSGSGSAGAPGSAVAPTGPAMPEPGVGVMTPVPPAPGAPVVTAPPEAPRGKEEPLELAFPGKLTARFSSYGGALVSWKLADTRYERDGTKGELVPFQAEGRDPGTFFVNFWRGSKYVLPLKTEWVGTKVSNTEVRYKLTRPELEIEKTYTIDPEAYLVRMSVRVKVNVPADQKDFVAPQQLVVSTFAFQDPKLVGTGGRQVAARVWASATLRGDTIYETQLKALKAFPRKEVGITWTGFEHPYLLAAYAPKKTAPTEQIEKRTRAHDLLPDGLMETDILFPQANFRNGETEQTRELVAFLGPKNYRLVEAADDLAGFPSHFKSTVDLGWFSFIGRPLLWLLLKLHSVVGNWGVAIIILTIMVKLLTLYWMTKSMRSMKAMSALAPQIKEIQAKHKEDRPRQQAETMALYKQHSVNPIAGCLPILLQMPVWIALYRMLSTAGELYQQAFIPGWIDDLTNTDPYHILPVVLVVTMFLQARVTPSGGDSTQQKIMQYGMPLMFGVMSFFFPSGLTLYIFTNTVLSAAHSIYMNKYDKKMLAIVAQVKKNQEAAAAKAAGTAGKPAKKVIDTTATSNDDDSDAKGDGPSTPKPRPQQRRKKQRR